MIVELAAASWEEAEEHIKTIESEHGNGSGLWFRGQADASWALETTLERHANPIEDVLEYYRVIGVIKPAVEAFTSRIWNTPPFNEIEQWTRDYDTFSRKLSFGGEDLAYDLLAHLRHQGFPSPLLDWTSSPYVAAYFAFASSQQRDSIAIHVFVERAGNLKSYGSGAPTIHGFGPNVRTHRRHFWQQSRYTVCAKFSENSWKFVRHGDAFSDNSSHQDLLWKIVVPATERLKVLCFLDKFNLNAFSLFDSEESLLEMLAFREIELRRPKPVGSC